MIGNAAVWTMAAMHKALRPTALSTLLSLALSFAIATPARADDEPTDPPVASAQVAQNAQSGVASIYSDHLHGRPTASGESFDSGRMTAAHRTLPFGTLVEVTNPATGAASSFASTTAGRSWPAA